MKDTTQQQRRELPDTQDAGRASSDPRSGEARSGEQRVDATLRFGPASEGLPPVAAPEKGRYEDLGRIGRGGMGEVRRVLDKALGRELAMKLQSWEALDTPYDRARFIAEVRLTARLDHPGIVPVHDWGELPDGRLWFTMREVRGRTLREVIAERHERKSDPTSPWSLRRLLDDFKRAAETVAYAHDKGVLHRDLKPDNIMIGAFGEVLVLDWGLGRRVGAKEEREESALSRAGSPRSLVGETDPLLTQPGDVLGTPAYMPPEQARGEIERLSPASDVYALGAILYEILTGRPPYTGSAVVVFAEVRKGPPPALEAGPELPAELVAICERAMAREPEARFPDAAALAEAIRGFLDGARRRERALEIVTEARAMRPRIAAMRARAQALREKARALVGPLPSFAPVDEKAPGWRMEVEAEKLERAASVEEIAWLQTLGSALNEAPDLGEAHADLAHHYAAELVAAEAARDVGAALRCEALLRVHDRGQYAALLRGEGSLSLTTNPEGAEVSLYRYVERDRRLTLEYVRELGQTPLLRVVLPRGSYLLKLRAPGLPRCDIRCTSRAGSIGTARGRVRSRRCRCGFCRPVSSGRTISMCRARGSFRAAIPLLWRRCRCGGCGWMASFCGAIR